MEYPDSKKFNHLQRNSHNYQSKSETFLYTNIRDCDEDVHIN